MMNEEIHSIIRNNQDIKYIKDYFPEHRLETNTVCEYISIIEQNISIRKSIDNWDYIINDMLRSGCLMDLSFGYPNDIFREYELR